MSFRKLISGTSPRRFRVCALPMAILCAGLLLFNAADNPAVGQESTGKICIVEARSYPGPDPAMWDGLYAARDGQVYSALINEGESSHFYVYDPAKDRNEMLFDLAEAMGERGKGIRTSGKIHNKPVEDNDGNIYFVTLNNGSGPRNMDYSSWPGGNWLRYDPRTRQLENMGLVAECDGLYPLAIDTNRLHLFGIGFTGYLLRFDINKRETKNLGRVAHWDVCRNIFADDQGNVYGSFPVARVWKYDAKSERVFDLKVRMPFDPTAFPTRLADPSIDRSYEWRAVAWDPIDHVAYGVTCGSGSILFRFDPHDGPEGTFTSLTRMCDSRFLTPGQDPLGPVRPDIPYSTLAFALDSKRKKVWFAPSSRSFSMDRYVETFGSDNPHHLILYDIASGKRIDCGEMRTSDGRRVFGCEAATVAPDGTVYICGLVEVRDRKLATRHAGRIPVALHLIIYRPDF